ncbi:twin-arginine translocase subunit TatB [Sphingomonas ginkgonis]|uniref:Twin-arginine translocase subunit TatB n=1 Tax=Sphingomonas ginkgonis TaxID=2315330 RepID=A0A3R9WQB8_9SPHN|nr:Sec-independent protein translocase protein TatB [Sphingomonas ginkgonis]RST31805.1 twin-arginine translocase subunit TatB [Sphingomonas ginkgonis]
MFGIDSSELLVLAVLALVFIGPKDLPRVLHTVGRFYGRARGMARHFTAGIENMMREAELEEMEKRWREENERIMNLHPANAPYPEPGAAGLDPATTMMPQAGELGPPPGADAGPIGLTDTMPPVVDPGRLAAPAPSNGSDEEPQLPLPRPPARPLP